TNSKRRRACSAAGQDEDCNPLTLFARRARRARNFVDRRRRGARGDDLEHVPSGGRLDADGQRSARARPAALALQLPEQRLTDYSPLDRCGGMSRFGVRSPVVLENLEPRHRRTSRTWNHDHRTPELENLEPPNPEPAPLTERHGMNEHSFSAFD